MADTEKRGIVARWLIGKERDEDYARNSLPTNRWSLFWDIFKGRLGRIVIVNFMVLASCLPIIAIFILRFFMVGSAGMSGPFGGAMGWSFPIIPNITGEAQLMILRLDLFFYALLIPAGAIAAIGISGGMYIIRNLIWTEGVFISYDFWRGVRKNYFNVLEAVLIFTCVLLLARTMGNLADYWVAVGAAGAGWMVASKVIGYIFVAFFLLVCLWMVSLGVNYYQGPWALLRNAIVMAVGTFPQTVFFAALAVWPFFLVFFGGLSFFGVIGWILLILFSFSYALLVWMDYSQWAFDRFINPDLGIQTGRGLYDRDKQASSSGGVTAEESEIMREYKRRIIASGKSKLASKPIKPIDDGVEVFQLSDGFSREDLKKLRENKEKLEEDVKQYEQEHRGDERYVSYNREFDELEKALREDDEAKKKSNSKKKRKKRPELLSK